MADLSEALGNNKELRDHNATLRSLLQQLLLEAEDLKAAVEGTAETEQDPDSMHPSHSMHHAQQNHRDQPCHATAGPLSRDVGDFLQQLQIGDSPEQGSADIGSNDSGNNAKRKNDDTPAQPRAKRNRYISIACNECKRRKIKCNGQTPCQRCGNLNLDCQYAPNCCNNFKESEE